MKIGLGELLEQREAMVPLYVRDTEITQLIFYSYSIVILLQ